MEVHFAIFFTKKFFTEVQNLKNKYLDGSFTRFVSGIPVELADGGDGLPQHQSSEGDDDQGQRRAELDQTLAPQQVRIPQLVADVG